MHESQWPLLVGSIYSFILSIVFWVVLRPKVGTWKPKPDGYAHKLFKPFEMTGKQYDEGYLKFAKSHISFMGIFFFIMSIVMMVGFVAMFFK